jgi:hypothetical protein
MQYYHPDFFQELVLGLGLDWCKFVQNGKTLGQFFELLYMLTGGTRSLILNFLRCARGAAAHVEVHSRARPRRDGG